MSASPAASAGKMTMSAEYAKSGRSSCKGCSASIAKGALRLGASALDLRGYDSTKWYHVVCFPASSHPLGPVEKVKGFDSIKDDDREQLRELEKDICSLQNNKRDQTAVSPLEVPSPKKAKAHLSSHETGVEENSSVSVEYAKSARSSCKGCSVSIAKGALRLGVSYRDARGFDSTNWYHVTCFPTSSHPLCPIENVKGFNSIKDDDREELRELEKDNKRDQATIVPLEVPGPKKANALISSPEVEEAEKRDQTVSPLEVPSRKKVKAHRSSPEVAVEDASVSVEYAKSARSSCRGCSMGIAKGSLRFGVPVRDRRGFDSTKWYHVTCFPMLSHPLGPIEKVKGFDSIKDDDRDELRELEKDNKRDEAAVGPLEDPRPKKANALISSPKVEVAEKRDQTAVSPLEVPSRKKAKAHRSSPEVVVEQNSSVSVEYAKSARSSCRGCSLSIAKGSLRFGIPVPDLRGDSTKWYHVTCFPTSSHPLGPIEKVKGFDSIKDDEREELRELEKDNKRDEAAVGPLEVPRPKKANAVISSPKVEVEEKTAVSPLEVPSQKKAKAHRSSPEVAVEDASVSVEYAKSARSSCRGCSVSIAKGSLRFGVPVRDRRGFDSTKWYHVTCFPTSLHPLGPIEKVKGFDSIKDDDREELRELEKDNKRDLATVSPLEVPSLKKANALIFAPKVDVAEKLSPGKKRISP
ncbi:polynucleotide 3'-phosphatase ZDP isoform X11 [Brachypodium distachyon]|uniref:polynucleotide 3'-phosphatase ZDP isoform X11 n=1 Tax=Brachypodium distachyon TaxID=15368 RepID=UPI000D0D0A0D|nr:polynucleotide 3'-phosphatase ZDP isoform X11 [Brachypodium distachyon]|eukprot:XP_024314445.1 polynucleotide 3'-phosphatase ZDP isoform X11 [Brachypodium distachyon]